MKTQEQLFLEALKASLTNTTVTWTTPLTTEEWQSLFALAESHKVLTLIFHAVYSCPAAASLDEGMFLFLKHRTRTLTLNQVQRTAEFLKLYEKLAEEGITPLIMKGLICRELYPKPDLRISADEDILVPEENFESFIQDNPVNAVAIMKTMAIQNVAVVLTLLTITLNTFMAKCLVRHTPL